MSSRSPGCGPATTAIAGVGDLIDACPRACRGAADRGLDHTHTWGRTYWGGALFCLPRRVEIASAPAASAAWSMPFAASSPPAQ